MNDIYIREILKGVESFPVAGEKFYEIALPILEDGQIVNIHMDDVDSLPTLFMNTSFAPLAEKIGKAKLMSLLRFSHIQKSQVERIKKFFSSIQN